MVLCLRLGQRDGDGHRRSLLVATTHLKARKGPQLTAYREKQGRDLARYLQQLQQDNGGCALILTGDFNAEPSEPVFRSLTGPQSVLKLTSAYRSGNILVTNKDDKDEYLILKL